MSNTIVPRRAIIVKRKLRNNANNEPLNEFELFVKIQLNSTL